MNIFDWYHISSRLTEDEKEELKFYYKVYHRKCWAFKKVYIVALFWETLFLS